MVNSIGVAVVFIQGQDERAISTDEMQYVYRRSIDGALILTNLEASANLSWHWHYDLVQPEIDSFATSPWPGLPDHYYQGFDAAVGHQGFFYLFKDDRFVLYDPNQKRVMPGYPKEIRTSWQGLTPEFDTGIDAAVRDHQEAVYLFKDHLVARFRAGETTVEAGYPRPISDEWPDLPDYFETDLDAALWRADLQRIQLFKGKYYTQFSTVGANIPSLHHHLPHFVPGMDTAVTKRIDEPFGTKVHAALADDEGRIYFFKNDKYEGGFLRISNIQNGIDPGYPDEIGLQGGEMEEVWLYPTMEALGFAGSDGGLRQYLDGIREELGTQWVVGVFVTKYATMRPGYAKSSKRLVSLRSWGFNDTEVENFPRWFAHEVCHTFGAKDEYSSSPCTCEEKPGLFFKERNANCRKCAPEIMEPGYPVERDQDWPGVDPSFDTIDAAVQRSNGRIYFFKDDRYVRFMDFDRPPSAPIPIHPNFDGLPTDPDFNFRAGIDAAMRHDGKIYFFKNHKMVRFTRITDGADPGYRPDIKDIFTGMPPRFHADLDAACSGVQDRIYLFKNDEYVRFSTLGEAMDADYPKLIAEGFEELDGFFTDGLQAAVYGTDIRTYLFKEEQTARINAGYPCIMRSTSEEMCRYTRGQIGWGPFMTRIDAAVMRSNRRIYLFSGDHYIRISDPDGGFDANYPKPIAGNFPGLPESFQQGIDAALWAKNVRRLYFFKGDEFISYANVSDGPESGPRNILSYWHGMPPSFQTGIDAAVWNNKDHKIYFFRGDQYVKVMDLESGWYTDPQPISDLWSNLPGGFQQGIDAALMDDQNQKVYLFNGTRMLRFNSGQTAVENGWPKFINRCWLPFPELEDSV